MAIFNSIAAYLQNIGVETGDAAVKLVSTMGDGLVQIVKAVIQIGSQYRKEGKALRGTVVKRLRRMVREHLLSLRQKKGWFQKGPVEDPMIHYKLTYKRMKKAYNRGEVR